MKNKSFIKSIILKSNMKAVDTKEKIMDPLYLTFNNHKYEREYSNRISDRVKEGNILLSLVNVIFSSILLIFFICLVVEVNNIYSQLNLKLRKLRYEDRKHIIKAGVPKYYSSYVLVNETAEEGNITEYILPKEDYSYIVRQYLFAQGCLPVILGIFAIHSIILGISILVKKDNYHNVIAFINYGFFGMNFHIISGILRSFFALTSDPIFFIVAIQLFFRIIIIFRLRMKWFGVMIVTMMSILFQWGGFLSFHYKPHLTIVYYFSVDTLIQISSVVLAYNCEYNSKYEFFLLRRLNFEKEYLVNFLYYMGQGFFTYSNKKIIFVNEYMRKIINNYELLNSESSINNYRPHLQMDLNSSLDENSKFVQSPFLSGAAPNTSKFILERIFDNLCEVNFDLPNEVHEIFSLKETSVTVSSSLNSKFSIERFFQVIRSLDQFKNFTYVGKVRFKNRVDIKYNFEEILNKQYEILCRVIVHDNTDEFLEIIFSDVSNVIKMEREKTISSCRSMYLSKIAHEFKNPIASLIEISTRINEEANNINTLTIQNICCLSDYSINICKIMNRFLNDFTIFTSLRISCKSCYRFKECSICSVKFLCKRCNICNHCEKENEIIFEYKKYIYDFLETFKCLNNYEGKKHTFILDINTNLEYVKSNRELFQSILYNLLFHSYKWKNKSEIKIKIDQLENENIQFEIFNSGMEVNRQFIDNLNSMKLKFEDNSEESSDEINSDRFNKYFKLYISFCLARKIGSFLKIETNKLGTKFSFIVKSNKSQVEIRNFMTITSECYESVRKNSLLSLGSNFQKTFEDDNENETKTYDNPLRFSYNKIQQDEEEAMSAKNYRSINGEDRFSYGSSNSIHTVNVIYNEIEDEQLQQNTDNIIRILVVDDEVLVRNTLKRYLKRINDEGVMKYHLEFYEAENCFHAIEIIYKGFNQNILFNYVMIDEYMPFMKGSTLIKIMTKLHQENNFYKINFTSYTSFDTNEKKKFIMDHGADHILNKPISYDDYKEFILSCLTKL